MQTKRNVFFCSITTKNVFVRGELSQFSINRNSLIDGKEENIGTGIECIPSLSIHLQLCRRSPFSCHIFMICVQSVIEAPGNISAAIAIRKPNRWEFRQNFVLMIRIADNFEHLHFATKFDSATFPAVYEWIACDNDGFFWLASVCATCAGRLFANRNSGQVVE